MKKSFIVILLLSFARVAHGREVTGASFLNFGPGARADALGGAFTALADDSSAFYWNPGGAAFLTSTELMASHHVLPQGSYLSYIGGAKPTSVGVFGFSFGYLGYPAMDKRDEIGNNSGSFAANDAVIGLSYSQSFIERMGTGVTVKMVRQNLDGSIAQGVAVDGGVLMETGIKGVSLGLAVRNFGPSLKMDGASYKMPLTVAGGVSYALGSGQKSSLSFDVSQKVYDARTLATFGFEYVPHKVISLRAGYAAAISGLKSSDGINKFGGTSVGLGFWVRRLSLDYSFAPSQDQQLEGSHKFSFVRRF